MSYFFFTESDKLNVQNEKAFGPDINITIDDINYEQYLVTSGHTATSDIKAIAVCDGQIFIQEQKYNSNLLNILFKPFEIQQFNFPKIKYFIYKGVKKESLISPDSINVAAKETNDLTNLIWTSYSKVNTSGSPSKSILGLAVETNGLGDDVPIEDVFLSNFQNVQFWNVKGGNNIGLLDKDNIGFEIILETPFYKPDLGLLRNNESWVRAKILSANATQNDFFEHWHDKELILNFIDPCAFFSAFYFQKLFVINGASTMSFQREDLYANVISKYHNKHKCYVDIRNEFNFSLNYMKNYGVSATDNTTNIKIGVNSTLVSVFDYYRNNWPIFVFENNGSNSQNYIGMSIKLPVADNLEPLIYFERAFISTEKFPEEYHNDSKFKSLDSNDNYTNEFNVGIPILNGNLISNYVLLKYGRRFTEEVLPDALPCQIRKTDYLDALFPLALNFDYLNSKLKTKVYDTELCLDVFESHNFIAAFSLLMSYDLDNITLFANPTTIKTQEFKKTPLSIASKFNSFNKINVLQEIDAIPLTSHLVKSSLKVWGTDLDILQFSTSIADVEGRFSVPDLRRIIGINISKDQWESIIAFSSNNFLQKYPVYISVDKTHLEDDDNKIYTSLNLKLKGYQLVSGNLIVNVLPVNINLVTYGIV